MRHMEVVGRSALLMPVTLVMMIGVWRTAR